MQVEPAAHWYPDPEVGVRRGSAAGARDGHLLALLLPALAMVVVIIVAKGAVLPDPELRGRAVRHPGVEDPAFRVHEPERLHPVTLAPEDLDLGAVGPAAGHLDGDVTAGARLHPHLARQVVDRELVFGDGVALGLLGREAGGGQKSSGERQESRLPEV
jgi:hypothetical protein